MDFNPCFGILIGRKSPEELLVGQPRYSYFFNNDGLDFILQCLNLKLCFCGWPLDNKKHFQWQKVSSDQKTFRRPSCYCRRANMTIGSINTDGIGRKLSKNFPPKLRRKETKVLSKRALRKKAFASGCLLVTPILLCVPEAHETKRFTPQIFFTRKFLSYGFFQPCQLRFQKI